MKTSMIAKIAAFGTAASLIGMTATAGSLDTTVVEVTPAAPVTVVPAPVVNDWTGGYVGASLGNSKATVNGNSENAVGYGLYGGYDYQFNNGLVTGAELEYQGNDDLTSGGVDVDNTQRAKARLGYAAGNTMVYGTAGVAKVNTNIGEATAPVYGLGAEYKVTERFGVGAEYLSEDFKNLGSTNTDLKSETLNLRGTLRF